MALTRTTATGRGKTSYRAVIEALGTSFVTNRSMATAADSLGRRRAVGLSRDGLVIDDRIDLAKAQLDAQGMTLTIGELPWARYATQCFAQRPSIVTYLNANLTSAGTALTVLSTSGMSNGDVIHVGRESILIGTVASGTSLTGCTRAYWNEGVPAFAHYTADGDLLRMPEVTNRPDSIEGRRVFLYMYDGSMSPTSEGVLVWRGICASEAQETGRGEYRIAVDSIQKLLQQDLGGDLDTPVQPRGIYYPWNAPFELYIRPHTGATYASADGTRTLITIAGEHYESQADFVAAVNGLIGSSAASALGVRLQSSDSGGSWWITVEPNTAGGGPFYTDVWTGREYIDETHGLVESRPLCAAGTDGPGSFGDEVSTVAADTVYVVPHRNVGSPEGAGSVPRGYWGYNGAVPPTASMDHTPISSETKRIYLGGAFVPDATTTSVKIDWPDGSSGTYGIYDYSTADKWIETLSRSEDDSVAVTHAYTSPALPTITPGRRFSANDFGELITAITAAAPDYAELGATPNLTTADIDATTSAAAITASIAGQAWLTHRDYTQFGSKQMSDVFGAEALMSGVIPTIGADGRIVYRRWGQPVASGTGTSITAAQVITSRGFPEWEKNANGSISRIILKCGYRASTDSYEEPDLIVRNVASISRNPTPRDLEIEPVSKSQGGDDEITYDDLARATETLFGVLGRGYEIVTVSVPFQLFKPNASATGVTCGDQVFLTCSTLPDTTSTTGHRGVTDAPCLVIGRRWDLGTGIGTLTLLLTSQQATGYAPVLAVTGQSDQGSNLWTLTCSFNAPTSGSYKLTGDVAQTFADCFAIGDKVRVREHDSDAPATVSGTVTDVTSTTVKVQFTGVWTPGASTWILCYDAASTSPSTTQRNFAYLAGTDAMISFGTGDEKARQVA